MTNLQASYNKDANNFVEQAEQWKEVRENLIFLIDLATVGMVAEENVTTNEEPKIFNKAWNHPDME